MVQSIFITGIGTDTGKTLISAILAEAMKADYWKPVQAGFDKGTDSQWVKSMLTNTVSEVHPEAYKFKLPASPHIAARNEDMEISLETIFASYSAFLHKDSSVIIEGAGGLMVPLNETEFVCDLIRKLNSRVILVSRNYLGSINHSILTAQVCRQKNIRVLGWIFNDQFMDYEDDIVRWTGYPKLGSVPKLDVINKEVIREEAEKMKANLSKIL